MYVGRVTKGKEKQEKKKFNCVSQCKLKFLQGSDISQFC